MTSFTLATPLGGGTFSMGSSNCAVTHLTGNKFVAVFQQTGSGAIHVYAQVFYYNGASAPTYAQARIIRQNVSVAPTAVRVLRFGDDRALVLMSSTSSANLEIMPIFLDGSDNITEGTLQTVTTLGATIGTITGFASERLSDTRFRFVVGVSTTIVRLWTPTINGTTGEVTFGSGVDVPSNSSNSFLYSIQRLPNTSTFFEHILAGGQPITRFIDDAGATSSTLSVGTVAGPGLISFVTPQRGFGLNSGTQITPINNGVAGTAISQSAAGGAGMSHAIALDNNHCLGLNLGSSTMRARVVRLLSDGVAETSSSTTMNNGAQLLSPATTSGSQGFLADGSRFHTPWHQWDANTFIIFYAASTMNRIGYRTIQV